MKFVRQFMIILAISFVGELLHALLPLPVPASIYGLVLMLIGLQTGILPLNAVNEAGGFLIEIMPMLFIPAGVGLMVSWGALKPCDGKKDTGKLSGRTAAEEPSQCGTYDR